VRLLSFCLVVFDVIGVCVWWYSGWLGWLIWLIWLISLTYPT